MNGVLWKWTNYYNGWQPRWFVLKDGILSYFRSEDEVNSGSKGSINLSVCDLNVNTYDSSRFEIIIPGEQKYFLKASNTQERQRWIVALGTGKACHTEPEFQLKERVGDYYLPLKEISFKESELRVYLELMNQQVCSIKSQLFEDVCPDISVINELTSTLNAACDTFLGSLKALVSIATTTSGTTCLPDSAPTYIGSPVFSSLPIQNSTRINRQNIISRHSIDSTSNDLDVSKSQIVDHLSLEQHGLTVKSRRETNFLVEMSHSFVDWSHQIDISQRISTIDYIQSLSSLVHFLDYFEAQPIVSLKTDIIANIKKLSLKYGTDEGLYSDLRKLIEPDDGVHVNSPTSVLRCLHRTMVYVECVLSSLLQWLIRLVSDDSSKLDDDQGSVDLRDMLIEAFNRTTKEKLNWVERGQFKMIVQSCPSMGRLLCHLLLSSRQYGPCTDHQHKHSLHFFVTEHRAALHQLIVDLTKYCHSISTVNKHLSHLFTILDVDL